MKVAITGSSGLIGTRLTEKLKELGHEPIRIVRRPAKAENEIQWDPANGELDPNLLNGIDGYVNLAGAGIGDKRWKDSYRKVLVDSRVDSTTLLSETLASLDEKPKVLLSGSAIGIYGDTDGSPRDEFATQGEGFLADLTRDWEAATIAASDAGIRTCHLRTGIVLSPKGGALKKMLPLFKLCLGGKFGNGKQVMSWITLEDEVDSIIYLLTANVSGPVNLTAPNPCTNKELTDTLASQLNRPSLLPVPAFGPRLLLGKEMADNLLFYSQNIVPTQLQESGFEFGSETITEGLDSVLG